MFTEKGVKCMEIIIIVMVQCIVRKAKRRVVQTDEIRGESETFLIKFLGGKYCNKNKTLVFIASF